jgi:hypothetical protein
MEEPIFAPHGTRIRYKALERAGPSGDPVVMEIDPWTLLELTRTVRLRRDARYSAPPNHGPQKWWS